MPKENAEEPVSIRHTVLKIDMRRNSVQSFMDEIVVESQVSLYINGHPYAMFSVTPFEIKELIVGHLMAEGIIDKLDEIVELKIDKERVDVQLSKEVPMGNMRIVSTECGSRGRKIPPQIWMNPKKQGSSIKFTSQAIMAAAKNLNSSAETYRKTGGTHAAALMDEQGCILAVSEDISRHSAVDKAIGKAVLQGLDFKEMFLTSSGRITSDIVIKAANVRIPVIVSISAPTDKGVKLAEMMGVTLIGFARGRRFNIYAHPERVVLHENSGGSSLCA